MKTAIGGLRAAEILCLMAALMDADSSFRKLGNGRLRGGVGAWLVGC